MLNKMTREDIITELRDDEKYYGQFGNNWMSNSDIKILESDPASYGADKGFEIPLEQGKAFHWNILEPEKFESIEYSKYASRTAKAYKDEIDLLGVKGRLLKKEVEQAKLWGDAILANDHFRELIEHPDAQYEVPAIGTIMGYAFKGKNDILLPNIAYDLKSTSDISQFKWNAKKYGYDSQAYIYEQLFGVPLVFLVVCKKTLQLGKFYPTPDFLLSGKERVERALENYERFYGDNPTADIKQYFVEVQL